MIYQKLLQNQKSGIRQVVATITQVKGSAPREVGTKMIITENSIHATIGGGALEQFVIEEARKILHNGGSQKSGVPLCSKVGQCCGGYVEIFFDIVETRPQLFVFGAGHIAQALLEVLSGTEWDTHLIDERPEWIQNSQAAQSRLPQLALETHLENPLEWIKKTAAPLDGAYALVMTHDHVLDQDIVEILMQKNLRFLGLIGSQTKKERFLKRLSDKGVSKENLSALHCPVGQIYQAEIKSKNPKIVATSIAFQLFEELMNEKSLRKKGETPQPQFEIKDELLQNGL